MLVPIFKSDDEFKEKLRIMALSIEKKEKINAMPADGKCDCGAIIKPRLQPYGVLKAQWYMPDMCEECWAKSQKEESILREQGNLVNKIYKTVPQQYLETRLANCCKEVQTFFNQSFNPKWLYIHGTCGTGKTYSLYAMWKNYTKQGEWAIIINSVDLLDEIKARFKKDSREDTDIEFIDKLCDCGTLLLDDLGAEKATDWVQERIYKIINTRYENGNRTIITSNKNLNQLKESLGDRITSRIAGKSIVVELTGEDKRLAEQKKQAEAEAINSNSKWLFEN